MSGTESKLTEEEVGPPLVKSDGTGTSARNLDAVAGVPGRSCEHETSEVCAAWNAEMEAAKPYDPRRHPGENETDFRARLAKERRERIATAVLAGFAAGDPLPGKNGTVPARYAVAWADALILELDK